MPKYENSDLGVSFEVPDDPTILQLMNYDEFEVKPGQTMYVRLWNAAKHVIEKWECDEIPLNVDLSEVGSNKAIEIIKWASRGVMDWRFRLKADESEKN